MKFLSSTTRMVLVLTAFAWLSGCVQTSSVPGYARAGDTVMLGLGGVHRNVDSNDILKFSDVTIVITDNAGTLHPVEASKVFKSYPAYGSVLNESIHDGLLDPLDMQSFDGGWFVSIPLFVPGSNNTVPLALAVGPATVSITSPKLTNTFAASSEGNLDAIPIEIIPGVAAFDSNFNEQFAMYQQSYNSFVIRPDDLAGVTEVAGAYFELSYSNDTLFKPGLLPMVLPSNHNPYVQLSYNVVENGDGTGKIYVTLLNPAGFAPKDTVQLKQSVLSDLSIKLQYFPQGSTAVDVENSLTLEVADSYYIDMNGDVIASVAPTITHMTNL